MVTTSDPNADEAGSASAEDSNSEFRTAKPALREQQLSEPHEQESSILAGERIALLGRLGGMTHQAAQVLIEKHGGTVARQNDSKISLYILGDECHDLEAWIRKNYNAAEMVRQTSRAGNAKAMQEYELWAKLGLVEESLESQRFYTPAMLAELVGVKASAIRRWHRQGFLVAARQVRRLAFFEFSELAVARKMAELLAAGCSLHVIESKLKRLALELPEVKRPLLELPLVVEGKRLLIRRGESLTEPSGQRQFEFDAECELSNAQSLAIAEETPVAISIEAVRTSLLRREEEPVAFPTSDEMLSAASDLESSGDLAAAADMYRAVLAAEPTAETNFLLADALYQQGDLTAARERYYSAIELDETFVEARVNLGCVLAETGEAELAVAAFEGALALQVDYADIHFHLARTLDRLNQTEEAEAHWHAFLNLAPESPWADEAIERLEKEKSQFETSEAEPTEHV